MSLRDDLRDDEPAATVVQAVHAQLGEGEGESELRPALEDLRHGLHVGAYPIPHYQQEHATIRKVLLQAVQPIPLRQGFLVVSLPYLVCNVFVQARTSRVG